MDIRFWGTRGSLAKPGRITLRHGGNTSCVEVRGDDGTLIVLDCGTGAHGLGQALLSAGLRCDGHLMITHTHWDHIQGFPFFAPLFVPGNTWDIYAPGALGRWHDKLEGGFLLHLRARRRSSVRRLIRNLPRSPRPAPVDRFLERPAEREYDQHEHNADHDDLPLRNRASRAHARGHPDAGRRGEPVHVLAFLASDNHTRAEKPDARHDALDHTARVGAGHRVDRQNGQGRAQAHEAKRAHPGLLAVQIAVEPK